MKLLGSIVCGLFGGALFVFGVVLLVMEMMFVIAFGKPNFMFLTHGLLCVGVAVLLFRGGE